MLCAAHVWGRPASPVSLSLHAQTADRTHDRVVVLLEPRVTNRRRQSVLAIVAGVAAFGAVEGAEPPAAVYGLPLVVSRPLEAPLVSGAYALDAFVFVDVAASPVPTSVLTPPFVD